MSEAPNYEHLTRQLDIIPVAVLDTPITVVGTGAIGSFLVLALAKMGFHNITVYDFDDISIENMNCQFFRFSDIGKPKTSALADLVKSFTNIDINVKAEKYVDQELSGLVITPLDSMAVRSAVWGNVKDNMQVIALIDPRMGAEYATCYVAKPMDPADQAMYEATLFSDDDAVQDRCTAKSTMYTVLLLSGHVSKVVKDYLTTEGESYIKITLWDIAMNFQECRKNNGELSGYSGR